MARLNNVLYKITGNGFTVPKPVPTAADNGDGTAIFTIPGVGGAARVLLSFGADEDADDAVVDVTRDGTFTTDAYEADATVYYKAQTFTAGGVGSGWSTVASVAVTVPE